ncbi:MAG: hypothetical protein Q8L48_32890 [Archangium sp.]|nr:hypothetical protein [Archangium sp.]
MKRLLVVLALALPGSLAWAQPVSVSVVVQGDTFDERLSPYGSWLVIPGYGRVWQPANEYVGDDFYPYGSDGHWVFTDEGWVFDSDYPFGWAVFHYGRWMLDPDYGWVWLPGNTWAPAWVTWRHGGSYVGWAPMGPRGAPVVHRDHWLFVESRELTVVNVRSRAVDQRRFRDAVSVTLPVHAAVPIGRAVPIREVHGASRSIPPPPPRDQQVTPRPPRTVRDAPYRAPPPPPQSPARVEPDRRILPPPPARVEQRERVPQPPPPGRVEPQRAPPQRMEPQRAPPPPPGRVEPQRAPPPGRMEPQRGPPPPPAAAPGQPQKKRDPVPGGPPPPSRRGPR